MDKDSVVKMTLYSLWSSERDVMHQVAGRGKSILKGNIYEIDRRTVNLFPHKMVSQKKIIIQY
jgi:hypothetical protein